MCMAEPHEQKRESCSQMYVDEQVVLTLVESWMWVTTMLLCILGTIPTLPKSCLLCLSRSVTQSQKTGLCKVVETGSFVRVDRGHLCMGQIAIRVVQLQMTCNY